MTSKTRSEYPRVPRSLFGALCQPDGTGACHGPGMGDWQQRGEDNLGRDIALNVGARALWNRAGSYGFELKPDGDAAAAIESLFVPSRDFKRRNLLYCDHVIHILISKRSCSRGRSQPDTAWLTHLVDTHVVGWIRIDVSWNREELFSEAMVRQRPSSPR